MIGYTTNMVCVAMAESEIGIRKQHLSYKNRYDPSPHSPILPPPPPPLQKRDGEVGIQLNVSKTLSLKVSCNENWATIPLKKNDAATGIDHCHGILKSAFDNYIII